MILSTLIDVKISINVDNGEILIAFASSMIFLLIFTWANCKLIKNEILYNKHKKQLPLYIEVVFLIYVVFST